MKRIIFTLTLSLIVLANAKAQEIEKFVFSSGNGSATNGYGESVSYTIGQSFFTHTLNSNNSVFLTPGFEQPVIVENLVFASAAHPDLNLLKLDMYPNPAIDYTDLDINLIDNDGAKVMLIDMWGQVVRSQDFAVGSGNQKLHFPLGTLADGVYTISVKANKRSYAKKLLVSSNASRSTSSY